MLLWIIFFIYDKGWDTFVYPKLMPDIQVTLLPVFSVDWILKKILAVEIFFAILSLSLFCRFFRKKD